jgi:L-threonylcarbamoyladenylate synthase
MKTSVLDDTIEDIRLAADIIKRGGLVAFPTETVYGLGADALNPTAVKKVYEAKGRPSDNPMIVHIDRLEALNNLVALSNDDAMVLAKKFWPGPMTMVLEKKPIIPNVTSGGLDTVGIRLPSNETARALIRESGRPIAAPSANISGRPSPTRMGHVIHDLDGKIDAIIRGGACIYGIESSVIDLTGPSPMILRPGAITKKMFEKALGKEVLLDPTLNKKPANEDFVPKAPGMKYKHYAPKADMVIYEGDQEAVKRAMNDDKAIYEKAGKKVTILFFGLSESDERRAAHDLFEDLRRADEEGVDIILASAVKQKGLGFSVMNRMLKSAGFNVKKV